MVSWIRYTVVIFTVFTENCPCLSYLALSFFRVQLVVVLGLHFFESLSFFSPNFTFRLFNATFSFLRYLSQLLFDRIFVSLVPPSFCLWLSEMFSSRLCSSGHSRSFLCGFSCTLFISVLVFVLTVNLRGFAGKRPEGCQPGGRSYQLLPGLCSILGLTSQDQWFSCHPESSDYMLNARWV